MLAAVAVGGVAVRCAGWGVWLARSRAPARAKARIGRSIDSLQRVVDSLRRYETAVLQDPATQERLAREIFGMVRGDKELLYRFADSAGAGKRP